MKRTFTASVWQEGNWFVAQCLEVDSFTNIKWLYLSFVTPGRVKSERRAESQEGRMTQPRSPKPSIKFEMNIVQSTETSFQKSGVLKISEIYIWE
ncbi:hypothetical protein A6S26_30010 [Nostoc sp. ATCC 43529]|nr:hypothetical protein A6S26_30010 [Nostoc sp. ATCC 43529]